jgi:hypothetical protein
MQPARVTLGSPTTPAEQCLAQIDNELVVLAESMRALRSRRNSLARVSCLPPEILATVFRHIAEEENSKSYLRAYRRRVPCMIVTHVCGHWRRVALECPSLWAFINWTSSRWIDVLLERSKKAALVVTCNTPSFPRNCLDKVLLQLPRIKVLRLHLYPLDVGRVSNRLLSQPAPLLQNFEFMVFGDGIPKTSGTIPDSIFQGQSPHLRSLEITNCGFTWTSCLFSGLRTLDVKGVGPTSSYPLPELLQALRRMPDLEWLTLEQLSITSEGNEVSIDRIPLVRLKNIVLDATIQIAVAIFARVALPDDARVALNLTKIAGHQSFSDLFSAMDKGPGKFGSVFRSLRARLSFRSSVIQFSTSMEYKPPSPWKISADDVRLSIEFHWNESAGIEPTVIFDIYRMITQDPTFSLSLSSSTYLGTSFWRTGSAHLPALSEIHLSATSIGGLLDTLRIEGTQNADIAYPSLHVLDLHDIEFQGGEPEDLCDVIDTRRGFCTSLEKLRLAVCKGLMAGEVDSLEEVIEDVDWDGVEEPLESEPESEPEYYGGCDCPECRDPDEPYYWL